MMLTALRLGNFKAFAETQRVPIRPLTLIFGANSSGKSSLIHGFLLARHALETGDLDVHRIAIGGESVDLGGFRQYIHRREASRQVEWAVELDTARLTGRLSELLAPVRTVILAVYIGLDQIEKKKRRPGIDPRTGENILIEEPTGELISVGDPYVQSWRILADGKPIITMSRRRDESLRLDRLDREHPVVRNILKNLVEVTTTVEAEGLTRTDYEGLEEALDSLVPEIAVQIDKFLPTGLLRKETTSGISEQALLLPVSRGQRREQLAAALRLFLPYNLDELLRGLSEVVGRELTRLQYLGPLRSYPLRHLAFSQHHDPNWFAGGGYAWDVVRRDENVRKAINVWLGAPDRLQTPYELVVHQYVEEQAVRDAVEELYETFSHEVVYTRVDYQYWQNIDAEILARDFLSNTNANRLQELVMIDQRSNTVVSHRDVGIGISQVLPVLVAAYASTGKILAMEQPEIHLHPKLQAELGDVFIQSALGEQQNTFILETHSEHLILRIMRRMRDTTNGTLPAGLPSVHPKDVSILYVQPKDSAAVVRVLELDEEGQLLDPWPDGFFEEGFRERFA